MESALSESRVRLMEGNPLEACLVGFYWLFMCRAGRWTALVTGIAVGMITLFWSYGICFLLQQSRTIQYPEAYSRTSPFETFLLFIWHDVIRNTTLTIWAVDLLERLLNLNRTPKNFSLLLIPVWYVASMALPSFYELQAPVLATGHLTYPFCLLYVIFIPLLLLERRFRLSDISIVLLAGCICGLMQYGVASAFRMHQFYSLKTFVVVVVIEWPSILSAIIYFLHRYYESRSMPSDKHKSSQRRKRLLFLLLFFMYLAVFLPGEAWESVDFRNIQLDNQFYKLLPLMSAKTFQRLGTALVWTTTCSQMAPVFRAFKSNCFDASSLKVVAAAEEGGAVLGSKLAVRIGQVCGHCVGVGRCESDAWPGRSYRAPEYDSGILIAAPEMRSWPQHASSLNKTVRCVAFIRHPLARLRSLYLHARNGGEKWFKESGLEDRLDLPMQESVSLFIREYGQDYLLDSHDYLLFNVKQGCLPLKYEDFRLNFNTTTSLMLEHWGMAEADKPELLDRLQSYNPLNVARKESEPYASTSSFSEAYIEYVNKAIKSHDNGGMVTIIKQQAVELNYSSNITGY